MPLAQIAPAPPVAQRSVRDLVRGMASEIRDTSLTPERACALLAKLTALMGNIAEELTEAELAYNLVLSHAYQSEATANRAKILAECTPEYRRKREAKDAAYLVEKLTQSLKAILRQHEAELRSLR